MLYGMFSVGKTVLVGTTPGRVLLLRPPTDHTDSIVNPHSGIEEWVIRDWDEMHDCHEFLRSEGSKHYDWVWLDSISLWQDIGLDDIWDATKANNPSRNAKHAGKDKGEYGRNMDRLAEWVRQTVALDAFNFGITAHPTNRLDDPSGERRMMPWVQGKGMSVGVCGMMTLVGYYEVRESDGEEYRLLHTRTGENFYAKNQYAPPGSPWKALKNPTMSSIITKIEASRGAIAPPARARTRPKPQASTATKRTRPGQKGAAK